MATDEERLAQIREEETKTKFKGMFSEAMDEWVTKKKEEEATADPPKRTKQTGNPGFFDSLFGGGE